MYINRPHLQSINVYTDGSLKVTKNGKICGYGIYFPNKEVKNVSAPFTISPITNNRAELHAILQSIIRIKNRYTFDRINIFSDSEYSVKALNEWAPIWEKSNWKNSRNKTIENQDLIKKIYHYLQKYPNKIHIKWIPAHTGKKNVHSINNAEADLLANKGADKSRLLK